MDLPKRREDQIGVDDAHACNRAGAIHQEGKKTHDMPQESCTGNKIRHLREGACLPRIAWYVRHHFLVR